MSADRLRELLDYRFRDGGLLSAALTHPSRRAQGKTSEYERLEFLGDAILGMVVARELYERYPDASEGELTLRKAALASQLSTLEATCAALRDIEAATARYEPLLAALDRFVAGRVGFVQARPRPQ